MSKGRRAGVSRWRGISGLLRLGGVGVLVWVVEVAGAEVRLR